MTLETQYKNYKIANPESALTFVEWKILFGKKLEKVVSELDLDKITPKQKAEELVYKYKWLKLTDLGLYLDLEEAKKCALITVDEIINTLNDDIRDIDVRGNILLDLIDYWREVKNEIEKL